MFYPIEESYKTVYETVCHSSEYDFINTFDNATLIENIDCATQRAEDPEEYYTVKNGFDNVDNRKESNPSAENETTFGTMIINYESNTEGDYVEENTNNSHGDSLKKLRLTILQEVKDFEINNIKQTNLTRQEIELRLKFLEREMDSEIQCLNKKFAKSKQNIVKALELKRKNHKLF